MKNLTAILLGSVLGSVALSAFVDPLFYSSKEEDFKMEINSLESTLDSIQHQSDSLKLQTKTLRQQLQETDSLSEVEKDTANENVLWERGESARKIEFRGKKFTVFSIKSDSIPLQMYWKDSLGKAINSLGNLKALSEEKGEKLVFATNAGMYHPDRRPVGLFIKKGKQQVPLDTLSMAVGNFYLSPNGVFLLENGKAEIMTTQTFQKRENDKIDYATQSGPMLVIDGKLHPAFKEGSSNINIRSGVGLSKEGWLHFVISESAVNFYDFALLFQQSLACPNALFLDGGISQMYLPVAGKNDQGGNFGPLIGLSLPQ